MSTRESFFHCSYRSLLHHHSGLVRAWDEREALALFRDEIPQEWLRERGSIEVSRAIGPRRTQTSFDVTATS